MIVKETYILESDLGKIKIEVENNKLTFLELGVDEETSKITNESELIKLIKKELKEYFSGKRKVFSIPFELKGTGFQKKVWNELLKIPYGNTKSYKEIAESIGSVKYSRAVGNANNKNPVALIVPCHRVIGSNGKLVGYRGGLNIKEKLLEIEKLK